MKTAIVAFVFIALVGIAFELTKLALVFRLIMEVLK